jgi:thymidylate synthase
MRTFNTVSDAYFHTLKEILDFPDFTCSPRGQPIREILDYQFQVLYPTSEPIETLDSERNKIIAEYTKKEMELYNSCTNKVEDFAKASKFWEKIANPDGTINSAYGYLIWKRKSLGDVIVSGHHNKTPWEWCVESLKNDKDTRQAVLRFSLPAHHWIGNKDFVCTLHGNFLIRNDKLHLSMVVRSQDMYLGFPYDCVWFVSLMDKMIAELKDVYPDLTKGTYRHMTHSLHIYEKNVANIKKMIGLSA